MALASRSSPGIFVERSFAFGLLVLSAPLIAAIALFIRLTSGGPAFHRGTRLGRDKRPFRMVKLRTLRLGAEEVTRGELLTHRHDLAIRGGRFLRDTRLDELPQLWNIVRGDMSFVGPRPERPEVLQAKCVGIPGYERRFLVRPGLIGISQLFTPHGTPKRYRALLDNGVIRRACAREGAVCIVAITAWAVVNEVRRRLARQVRLGCAQWLHGFTQRRRLHRVAPAGASIHVFEAASSCGARFVDLNEDALALECGLELAVGQSVELVLHVALPGRNRPARRSGRCKGIVTARRAGSSGARYVVAYQACSPRSDYMIHQYFLRDSLAVPRRAWKGPAPARPHVLPHPPVGLPAPQAVLTERPHPRRVYNG